MAAADDDDEDAAGAAGDGSIEDASSQCMISHISEVNNNES